MRKAGLVLALVLASLTAACAYLGDIQDPRVSPGTRPTPERVN